MSIDSVFSPSAAVIDGDPRDVLWQAKKLAADHPALVVMTDVRADLEDEDPVASLAAVGSEAQVRIVGPGSGGVVAPHAGPVAVGLRGGTAFADALAAASSLRVELYEVVDVGLGIDVDLADLLERWTAHDAVGVIVLHAGRWGDPARFVAALRAAAAVKPVVILGPDADALMGAGAVMARGLSDAMGIAAALAEQGPVLGGGRIAVIANEAGRAELAAAAVEREGLTVATLSEPTRSAIASQVHTRAIVAGPVDLLGAASVRHVQVALDAAAGDASVDGLLVSLGPLAAGDLDGLEAHLDALEARTGKPIVVGPPDRAARNLGALRERAVAIGRLAGGDEPELAANAQLAQAVIAAAHLNKRSALRPDEARRVFEAYGVPAVAIIHVPSAVGARHAARDLGYPVTVTVRASDAPATRRVAADGEALDEAIATLFEEAQSQDPQLAFEVRAAAAAQAVSAPRLRVTASERLGHVATILHGTIHASAPLPLTRAGALQLTGDEAIADVAWRLARLATDLPEITRVETGPLAADDGGALRATEPAVAFANLTAQAD